MTIDEVVTMLALPPGAYVATSAGDDTSHVVISDHATGRVVAVLAPFAGAAAWCRAFNGNDGGTPPTRGWWRGRVVTREGEQIKTHAARDLRVVRVPPPLARRLRAEGIEVETSDVRKKEHER